MNGEQFQPCKTLHKAIYIYPGRQTLHLCLALLTVLCICVCMSVYLRRSTNIFKGKTVFVNISTRQIPADLSLSRRDRSDLAQSAYRPLRSSGSL